MNNCGYTRIHFTFPNQLSIGEYLHYLFFTSTARNYLSMLIKAEFGRRYCNMEDLRHVLISLSWMPPAVDDRGHRSATSLHAPALTRTDSPTKYYLSFIHISHKVPFNIIRIMFFAYILNTTKLTFSPRNNRIFVH